MNFRILCFIKILQPPLGWQNLDRTIAIELCTISQNKKWKWSAPPGSRIHKISSALSKSLVIRGGGWRGYSASASASAFYSVKLCVMIEDPEGGVRIPVPSIEIIQNPSSNMKKGKIPSLEAVAKLS